MKSVVPIFILIISAFTMHAQQKLMNILPVKESKVNYSEVITVDSASKDVLYNRAKRWYVDVYNSAQNVIQLDDKENGEIVGKGNFDVYWNMGALVGTEKVAIYHKLSIFLKDGRYKYEIADLIVHIQLHEYPIEAYSKNGKTAGRLYQATDDKIQHIIESLKKAMQGDKEKNDW
jgi:hypothetical protein